ncbi:MAG TPA: CDP-alcohol phosphatidyltransferase family protein [Polyangiales bacterium]|nr:CDP-alcohol phosphatidyltransferase family protein [Polyangiales bacterium]
MDLACSLLLVALLLTLLAYHAVRGRAHARVELEGKSALLGNSLMQALYGAIVPLARACARAGLGASAVTACSVLLAGGAALAFAVGHLGLAALLAVAALACDAVDGWIARATGTASTAGEVLDAAADRYVELLLFGGLVVYLRSSVFALICALAGLGGSFMVSYSTAKAEALGISPPRGSMRRTDRAFVLIAGAALTPIAAALSLPQDLPLLLALGLLAVASNGSALARVAFVASALRAREGPAHATISPASEPRP